MTIRDVRERFAETVIGKRLSTSEIAHQTAPNFIALAVLASDAMSSVAYATEEILIILNTAAISGFVALILVMNGPLSFGAPFQSVTSEKHLRLKPELVPVLMREPAIPLRIANPDVVAHWLH